VWVIDRAAANTKYAAYDVRAEHFFACTLGDNVSIAHGNDVIANCRRFVDVVNHHDNRLAVASVQGAQEVEHFHSVRRVEKGRGLVEQEDRRLLCQGHGDPDALTLATRELVDHALSQIFDTGQLEGALNGGLVVTAEGPERRLMREPAATDKVLNRNASRCGTLLREEPEAASHLLCRPVVNGLPIQQYGTRLGNEQARQGPKKRALAAAVWTDHGGNPTIRNLKAHAVEDRLGAIVRVANFLCL